MASYSILGSASDGYMGTANSTVYSTVRDAVEGHAAVFHFDDEERVIVGQIFFSLPPWVYQLYRGYLFFDCSAILGGETISTATLDLWASSWYANVELVYILSDMDTYPHDPVVVGDYDRTHYSETILGTILKPGATPAKIRTSFNSDGLAAINKGGWTKFCLRSKEDYDGTAPPVGQYFATFDSNERGVIGSNDYRPYLQINTAAPSARGWCSKG